MTDLQRDVLVSVIGEVVLYVTVLAAVVQFWGETGVYAFVTGISFSTFGRITGKSIRDRMAEGER